MVFGRSLELTRRIRGEFRSSIRKQIKGPLRHTNQLTPKRLFNPKTRKIAANPEEDRYRYRDWHLDSDIQNCDWKQSSLNFNSRTA
ncbi:hypothetical protein EVAR_25129_1 [Eumeta japonica]|uniref:Uncharacterized protein n=1 Tax=Eumeta variegata TaxID=151549 RepID=A0A4C1XKL3_EUMVA|nr:hypothetical protein EVAR_25129_1 [Eumeta japonica]